MNERGHRIREMADSLCRGKRYEAADHHVTSMRECQEMGIEVKPDQWTDFLAGFDAAMEIRNEELIDENKTLHGIILDLCARMCVERCKVCKGEGVDENVDPCPHCEQGWIDKP